MITDGTVDPDTTTVDYLETYTVVCDTGHTVSAAGPMTCQADETLDITHTCDSKLIKTCQKTIFRHIHVCIHGYIFTCINAYLPTFLPYLPTHILTNIHTCMHGHYNI